MGFFSWKTSDTKEEIWNRYTDKCKPVYMYCPDGGIIMEPAYEGYGRFGHYDAHALLAQWNDNLNCTDNIEEDRIIGINLECDKNYPANVKFPLKFSFSRNKQYKDLKPALKADYQGYFG